MSDKSPLPVRLLKGFGMFWWDFLVGDTPELFVAALVTIGVIALVSHSWHHNTLAVILLPVLATASLSISVVRAAKKAKGH